MWSLLIVLFPVVVTTLSTVFGVRLAGKTNQNKILWGILGFFFCPIVFYLLYLLLSISYGEEAASDIVFTLLLVYFFVILILNFLTGVIAKRINASEAK